jgi:hypothetical protein
MFYKNPYRFNYLYHRLTSKLNVSVHFVEKLHERFNMELNDLFPIIRTFVFHRGNKFCIGSLTINSKVSSGKYPYSNYLYSRKYDMIIVYDSRNLELITVERYNTDYFFK